ncbi:hypothetical protein GpartN1_g1485.t1 [Galdieria partita]|uniref:Uncharacterized protein n=1 Tax=Galdieria partita TaxID=83374 RepID=A0A9C7PSY0_9RHOD|nr:hypothetical protein GpartN1_g1485.t1 [Galdieria partita]
MSNEEATEQISTDSSDTKDEDEVVEEEEAKKLFDCQYLIPSHQIAYVIKWLQESFSLIELQVLKASLEKNDVASDESHIPNKLHSATYTEKGKQRIQILSQTIQMIQEVQQNNVHSQNIPDTIISKKYSEIPNDNEQMINQMEWNNIQYKAWSLQARTIPKKDSFRKKIYCLQQECQLWIEKLKNILIMLQHSIQYINTTDDNESLTLRPFTSECKKQAIVCLRKLRSSTGRLMILVLAEHFSIQHINLVFQCFCSSNGQGRNKSLTKIPRMHTTPSGHKNYHLKQCNCRNHRSHDDTKELLRQIAAIKIQTSWRAAMTRNNMLLPSLWNNC